MPLRVEPLRPAPRRIELYEVAALPVHKDRVRHTAPLIVLMVSNIS